MSVFSVDPEHLTSTAPRFGTAGSDLSSALDALNATLSGLGACWGGDEQGAAFAAQYEPSMETLAAATGNVSRGLTSIGEGIDAMGTNHATTDAGVASGLQIK